MAVVRLTPNRGVMAAAIENEVRHGMVAGNAREVEIDPVIALVNDREIDPVSASVIGPVPTIEIRTPPVLSLSTIAQA